MKGSLVLVSTALTLFTTALQTWADTFGDGANAFTIEFVTIGSAGNRADRTGSPNPAGSVAYEYRIGAYEVSRDMVDKANANGNLALTLADMNEYGGNGPNQPATGISWNEAARFVNWLNTSQGFPPAYKFALQPDAPNYRANVNIELWQSGDTGFDQSNSFRNSRAQYFLPSDDEWYKAAYFDPGTTTYYDYPTGSNRAPRPVEYGTAAGTAVYRQAEPAPITQAGGLSPFGVMALGGNVTEWMETESDRVNDSVSAKRDVRGGDWGAIAGDLAATFRDTQVGNPPRELLSVGFRVASLPLSRVGDFNNNGVLDTFDISQLVPGATDPSFDVTGDGAIDQDDRDYWVHELAATWYGDANLNGKFNSGDLVDVASAGEYEDTVAGNSLWNTGDWTGDGEFNSHDLVLAFQDGGYEQGPAVAVPVPEPGTILLLLLGLVTARRRGVVFAHS